jgi:hypothetical protein
VQSNVTAKRQKWVQDWIESIANGVSKMSSRSLNCIEKCGGGLRAISSAAKKRKVHLLLLEDDDGRKIVAASTKPFKVLA